MGNILQTPDGGTSFLDLPPEIRRTIYEDGLIASEQIQVYYSDEDSEPYTLDAPFRPPNLRGVSVNLLLACRTTAIEGARYFYGKNKFVFPWQHDYILEKQWLERIGPINRGYLSYLTICIRNPSRVWQWPDGTRDRSYGEWSGPSHERHPLLVKPQQHSPDQPKEEWEEGYVDDIDPDLEAAFCLLGLCASGSSSKITIILEHFGDCSPRILEPDSDDYGPGPFGTDLPKLVEAWRTQYSTHRDISVRWKLQLYCRFAPSSRMDWMQWRLAEAGWLIKDVQYDNADNMIIHVEHPAVTLPIEACRPLIDQYDDHTDYRIVMKYAKAGHHGYFLCAYGNAHRRGEEECTCTGA